MGDYCGNCERRIEMGETCGVVFRILHKKYEEDKAIYENPPQYLLVDANHLDGDYVFANSFICGKCQNLVPTALRRNFGTWLNDTKICSTWARPPFYCSFGRKSYWIAYNDILHYLPNLLEKIRNDAFIRGR